MYRSKQNALMLPVIKTVHEACHLLQISPGDIAKVSLSFDEKVPKSAVRYRYPEAVFPAASQMSTSLIALSTTEATRLTVVVLETGRGLLCFQSRLHVKQHFSSCDITFSSSFNIMSIMRLKTMSWNETN